MKRTPQSSITALLEGVEQAKQKKEFNILKDLKTLHAQYTRVNKRDYLALLDKLVEKYSTDEAAVIHAALLKKMPGRRYGRDPAVDGAAERERQRRGGGEHR